MSYQGDPNRPLDDLNRRYRADADDPTMGLIIMMAVVAFAIVGGLYYFMGPAPTKPTQTTSVERTAPPTAPTPTPAKPQPNQN